MKKEGVVRDEGRKGEGRDGEIKITKTEKEERKHQTKI